MLRRKDDKFKASLSCTAKSYLKKKKEKKTIPDKSIHRKILSSYAADKAQI